VADDHAAHAIRAYNSVVSETPQLDRLGVARDSQCPVEALHQSAQR
jgi:hypothetical protein